MLKELQAMLEPVGVRGDKAPGEPVEATKAAARRVPAQQRELVDGDELLEHLEYT